ncbi:MAG: hypothetical protein HSCHL_2317 [Hydrogenibacillus schlegelii]|uniref:Uncharacterized protein n=1 Tax=Hydrogenibacillus schlegelii TaxID=1484 RepID=A0A2T5GEW6_HYDSH|nr:MAG: hypothetical protein HSCHL_2317 [Hydrogenibacillus schlegelii]
MFRLPPVPEEDGAKAYDGHRFRAHAKSRRFQNRRPFSDPAPPGRLFAASRHRPILVQSRFSLRRPRFASPAGPVALL